MQLKHLTDEQLDRDLGNLIMTERETTTSILHHLREVERRRLFSTFGYSSLFEYAVKRFRYSEDQAYRRISAMRLLVELPEIEKKIESGELSLTNLAKAQKFFRAERKTDRAKSAPEKLELLSKLENRSKVEAEQVIAIETQPHVIDDGAVDVTFRASKEFQAKLRRLSEVLAHRVDAGELERALEIAVDVALEKLDPMEKAKRAEARTEKKIQAPTKTGPVQKLCVTNSRFISSATRHALYMRDRGCCRQCGSRHQIEIDHIVPIALGGMSELENLRLLCRSCNQRHAIETYGVEKISRFVRAPRADYLTMARGRRTSTRPRTSREVSRVLSCEMRS